MNARNHRPVPAPAAGDAIVAEDLSRCFGRFVAVDRVSFQIASGEVFGFLGPNGAGKTTTLKMLTGLLRPTGGRARVAGYDLAREVEAVKRHLGYMSQLFSLYGDLTVDQNIDFFSGLYGVPRERRAARRDWVLEMAGLAAHRASLVGPLPLGWKQRLALGCAVLHEPPILFLDEPTSGVDPLSRRRFWNLIGRLAEGGTTVLVSTHYMEEAEFCDRLVLLNRGRVVALDTPPRLRAAMPVPLVELVVDDGARAVDALRGTPGVLEAGLYGRAVHVMVQDLEAARRALPERLAARGVRLQSLEPIEPSLEDVFVALVAQAGGAPQ